MSTPPPASSSRLHRRSSLIVLVALLAAALGPAAPAHATQRRGAPHQTARPRALPGATSGRPRVRTAPRRSRPPVTARFKALYSAPKGSALAKVPAGAIHDVAYLVVPGLLGNQLRHVGYLKPTVDEIESLGGIAEVAEFNTAGRVEDAAPLVRDQAIALARRTGRPVRIISHSTGVPITSAALALYEEELAPFVDGTLQLQGAYRGSPTADLVKRSRSTKLLGGLARAIDGDLGVIDDLTLAVRDRFNAEHPFPTDRFPTVALATSRLSPRSPMFPLQVLNRVAGGEATDGLISQKRARIPGAHMVELDDMDHMESTLTATPGLRRYSARRTTRALITLLHEVSLAQHAEQRTASPSGAGRAAGLRKLDLGDPGPPSRARPAGGRTRPRPTAAAAP